MISDSTSRRASSRCSWLCTGRWEVCSSRVLCRRWHEGHPFRPWNLPRSLSMWSVPICQVTRQWSVWFKVFLSDCGCNRKSSALRATNEKINSVYQYLPFGAGKAFVIRLFRFIWLFWQVDTLVLVGGSLRCVLQINCPYGHSPSLP